MNNWMEEIHMNSLLFRKLPLWKQFMRHMTTIKILRPVLPCVKYLCLQPDPHLFLNIYFLFIYLQKYIMTTIKMCHNVT